MIVLNPFLDSLCNFGFKNIGLHPGVNFEWFPDPQEAVILYYFVLHTKKNGTIHSLCFDTTVLTVLLLYTVAR